MMPYYAPTDPVLVTLARAKAHLNVTDSDHDGLITEKMTAASATIRDYLKDRNDPTWTDATVPPWIAESVLLLLGNWYEHRGDEQTNDPKVWETIRNLLVRSANPAIA